VDAESDIDVDTAPTPVRDILPPPTLTNDQENDPIISIAHGKLLSGKLSREEFDHIVRMQVLTLPPAHPLALTVFTIHIFQSFKRENNALRNPAIMSTSS
jgi:hypothetical protein